MTSTRHFLHTADWQIGRQYGQFDPQDAAILEEARLTVIARIATLATDRQVNAVLVAGDVFDTQAVSDRTIRRLFSAMQGFSGAWVMIAGNHDAALAESVWTRALRLGCVPSNVYTPQQTGVVLLEDSRTAVLAAPLNQRHTYDDVTQAFDGMETPSGWLRIGLAHGSVAGRLPESADVSNPIAPHRAASARLDYLALGDWHGCLQIDERTWYAGTPETDRFRGNEPGAVLDIHIAETGALPQVERVDVGQFKWTTVLANMVVPSDVEHLGAHVAAFGPNDVVELRVSGDANVQTWETLNSLFDTLSAQVRSLRIDTTALNLQPDQGDLAALGASGYVVEVAQTLHELQSDAAQAPAAREALRLLLQFERELSPSATSSAPAMQEAR